MKKLLLTVSSIFLITSSSYAVEKDCGAAGDGCAPKEWAQYQVSAMKIWPNWPEIGYRTYASECYYSKNNDIKKLCISDPIKAAKKLKLPIDE